MHANRIRASTALGAMCCCFFVKAAACCRSNVLLEAGILTIGLQLQRVVMMAAGDIPLNGATGCREWARAIKVTSSVHVPISFSWSPRAESQDLPTLPFYCATSRKSAVFAAPHAGGAHWGPEVCCSTTKISSHVALIQDLRLQ